MDQIAAAAKFVRANAPELAHWPDETLVNWLAHGLRHKRIACVYDADKRMVGLGAARLYSRNLQVIEDWYHHDGDGDSIYVDMVITSKPGVMRILWEAMKHGFGDKFQEISFHRLRDEDEIRRYNFKRFDNYMSHGTKQPASTGTA